MPTYHYRVYGTTDYMALSGNALMAIVNKPNSNKKIQIKRIEIQNNTYFGPSQSADTFFPAPSRVLFGFVDGLSGGYDLPVYKCDSNAEGVTSQILIRANACVFPTFVNYNSCGATGFAYGATTTAGSGTFTPSRVGPSGSPAPTNWTASEHRDANRYFIVTSGATSGASNVFKITANTTTSLTCDPVFNSALDTRGYIAEVKSIGEIAINKTLLSAAISIHPMSNCGSLNNSKSYTGEICSSNNNTNIQAISINPGDKFAVFCNFPSIPIPLFIDVTFNINNKTYQMSYYKYLEQGLSILSIDNMSGSTISIGQISVSEVGTTDTPYFQVVPIGSIDSNIYNDSAHKLTTIRTDSNAPGLTAGVCEVFTNITLSPYNVPLSYIAEGAPAAAVPRGFNYLNSKDFIGPIYMTYFPEASSFKEPITAFFASPQPGTLNSQICHKFSTIKALNAPITLNEGEGIAIVSGAETATSTTFVPLSGWSGYNFGISFTVEPKTLPTITLTGLQTGSEVKIYQDNDGTELASTSSSSSTFSYQYEYSSAISITVVVMHIDWQYLRLSLTLTNSDQTVPVQQITDRVYANP